jgi:hypothetical protein
VVSIELVSLETVELACKETKSASGWCTLGQEVLACSIIVLFAKRRGDKRAKPTENEWCCITITSRLINNPNFLTRPSKRHSSNLLKSTWTHSRS